MVTLSWTVCSGATGYNVYRGTTAAGEDGTPIAPAITGTNYMDVAVTDGVTYYYTVAAVNAEGVGGFPNEASATLRFPPQHLRRRLGLWLPVALAR